MPDRKHYKRSVEKGKCNCVKLDKLSLCEIQAHAGRAKAAMLVTTAKFIKEKLGKEAVGELCKSMAKTFAGCLKEHGVDSPLSLVKAIESCNKNVYDATVVVRGDEDSVSVKLFGCTVCEAIGEIAPKMGYEDCKQMGEDLGLSPLSCTKNLAEEFGFKFDGSINEEEGYIEYTISR